MSTLLLEEQTAPGTPSTNQAIMYVKSDGKFYTKDDAGTESDVSTDAATQAQMETATNNTAMATPLAVNWHPGVPKCWCNAGIAGTMNANRNMNSVTDVGTGLITFIIETDFSSANWSGFVQGVNSLVSGSTSIAAGTMGGQSLDSSFLAVDPGGSIWCFVGLGDQ